jgi:tetratricopeptide (TPR) repeat protein
MTRHVERWEDLLRTFQPHRGPQCPEPLVLHHVAAEKLSVAELEELRPHLEECDFCQSELLELRKLLYFERSGRPYRVDIRTGRLLPLSPFERIWHSLHSMPIREFVSSLQLPQLVRSPGWALVAAIIVLSLVAGKVWVQPALAQSPPVLAVAKQVPLIRWLLPSSTQAYLEATLLLDRLASTPDEPADRWIALATQIEDKLKQAISLNPQYVDAYVALGSLYEQWYARAPTSQGATHLLREAEDYYNRAIKLEADTPDAHKGLANIYSIEGRYVQEEQQYDAILKRNPGDTEAQSYRGWVRLERGDYSDAIADFEAVVQHDPRDFEALSDLAFAYTANGDQAGAERVLAQMTRVNPGRAQLLRRLLRMTPPRR